MKAPPQHYFERFRRNAIFSTTMSTSRMSMLRQNHHTCTGVTLSKAPSFVQR